MLGIGTILTGAKILGGLVFGPSTGKGGDAIKMLEAGNKALTPLINMYDERKFTDEEKAKDFAAGVKDHIAFVKATLEESSERSRLRREVALWLLRMEAVVSGIYLFVGYKCVNDVTLVGDKLVPGRWETIMLPIAKDIWTYYSYGFLSVIVFFFGSHVVRGALDRLGGKK